MKKTWFKKKKLSVVELGIALIAILVIGLLVPILLLKNKVENLENDLSQLQKKKTLFSDFSKLTEPGVYLMKDYYRGNILRSRNSNQVNLTKKISEFGSDFTGYTTNSKFTRLLNAVELRNKDSLIIKTSKEITKNWQQYIRVIDTLSVDYNNQMLTFVKKENADIWESRRTLLYSYPKNMPLEIRNREGSCLSKTFFNALTNNEKNLIKETIENTSYLNKYSDATTLEELSTNDWKDADKRGYNFNCFQILKKGAFKVELLTSEILKFTFDGYLDFSFLEENLYVKYGMNYSYFQMQNEVNDSWFFITGLLYSNLDEVKNVKTDDLTYFHDEFRKATPGLYQKYNSETNQDEDNSYKDAINAKSAKEKHTSPFYYCNVISTTCSEKSKSFKEVDETFAGLYVDPSPSVFYKWYSNN